jgi:general secretion pathway protein B
MSILLEALRKSEKTSPRRSVPTIHSEDQSSVVSGPSRVGWIALILVVVFITSGWFIWNQYRAPAGDGLPVVLLAPEEPALMPTAQTDSGDSPAADTVTPPSSIAGDTSAALPRTPVESYQAPEESISQPGPDASQALLDNSPARPAPVTTPKSAPHKPEPISYWELPDTIRDELPLVKYSVLVYANNPEDRFVLVNGQRLEEGDAPLPGLKVEEIRRDGVVLSYRLYQFLVER